MAICVQGLLNNAPVKDELTARLTRETEEECARLNREWDAKEEEEKDEVIELQEKIRELGKAPPRVQKPEAHMT